MSKYIDKIIYINLNKRSDRKEKIEKELNNFNLEYERFEAIDYPSFGSYGCGLSHLYVLKLARERNYKNILILEDDFQFCVSKDIFEEHLTCFFLNIKDFDVCMLSYNLLEFMELENNIFNKVLSAQTSSGYIVNSNYYNKLIDLYEKAMPLLLETGMHWIYANDQIWKDYQKIDNWFYLKIRIGKQRPNYSNVANSFVDYDGC